MPADAFVDTNVLVYFTGQGEKASIAEAFIAAGSTISVQVLNELAAVWKRKYGYSWQQIREALLPLPKLLKVVPLTLDTHELGLFVAERYQLRIYDSLLLAAALEAGCTAFWSEDLHEGLVVERQLTIRNPFR
ncbi:MAG TPA: PIN domain-containing protein [Allosphingosinicella sp.]|nr:PIN domain-containing protein [Allosphingosinicella sp.]